MDATGQAAATPRDGEGCAVEDARVADGLRSGYMQRARHVMPLQGSADPWELVMNYQHNCGVLREDPIDDGILQFEAAVVPTPSGCRLPEMSTPGAVGRR